MRIAKSILAFFILVVLAIATSAQSYSGVIYLETTLLESRMESPNTGTAQVTLDFENTELCYTISIPPIEPLAVAAHIHSPEGGIAVGLSAPDANGHAAGCQYVSRNNLEDIARESEQSPESGYFINVHNNAYDGGELRGYLHINQVMTTSTDTSQPSIFADGRIVTSLMTPIYIRETGIQVYTAEGHLRFNVNASDLSDFAATPDNNRLIAEENDVALYKLTTGEYQINIGPDENGHVQVHVFAGLPSTGAYRRDFDVR